MYCVFLNAKVMMTPFVPTETSRCTSKKSLILSLRIIHVIIQVTVSYAKPDGTLCLCVDCGSHLSLRSNQSCTLDMLNKVNTEIRFCIVVYIFFFQEKDSYGNEVTQLGRPLPVEYLLVDFPAAFPVEPQFTFPVCDSIKPFPVENRTEVGEIQVQDSFIIPIL